MWEGMKIVSGKEMLGVKQRRKEQRFEGFQNRQHILDDKNRDIFHDLLPISTLHFIQPLITAFPIQSTANNPTHTPKTSASAPTNPGLLNRPAWPFPHTPETPLRAIRHLPLSTLRNWRDSRWECRGIRAADSATGFEECLRGSSAGRRRRGGRSRCSTRRRACRSGATAGSRCRRCSRRRD